MRKVIFLGLIVALFAWGFQLAPMDKADAQCDNAAPCDNYTPLQIVGFGAPDYDEFGRIGEFPRWYGIGCVVESGGFGGLTLNVPFDDCQACAGGYDWTCYDLAGVPDGGFEAPDCDDGGFGDPECTFFFTATGGPAYYHCEARCETDSNLNFAWGILVR
jgi:hypothetical protein